MIASLSLSIYIHRGRDIEIFQQVRNRPLYLGA